MKRIEVDATALRQLLVALVSPPHHIAELQATRGFLDNPIDTLINEFNAAIERHSGEVDQSQESQS